MKMAIFVRKEETATTLRSLDTARSYLQPTFHNKKNNNNNDNNNNDY